MRNKISLISLISIAVIILISPGCRNRAEKLHITVATDATWPPMETIDENNKIVGFEIDLMRAAAKKGGFTVEFKNTGWDGIFAGLNAGEYDAIMSSVTITEARRKTLDFSVAYINAGQVLVVRQGTGGVDKLADLENKVVGAQIGTTGSLEVTKVEGVELKTYDEIGSAFEDLAFGRIEAVVADSPLAAYYAAKNPLFEGKFEIAGEPFTNELYGVAVKKGNREVLDAINRGFKSILDTDIYQQIEAKWLR